MESSLKRGLPISLSRWTDVAHWYMGWLEGLINRQGFVVAPDPVDIVPKKWSLDPSEVFCLYFWTKNPLNLSQSLLTWLSPFRVASSVTITGWPEVEPRVPKFTQQIRGLEEVVKILGPELVTLRYSPIPLDFLENKERQTSFKVLLKEATDLGIEQIELSFLQPNEHYSFDYEEKEKVATLSRLLEMASAYKIELSVCSEDLHLMHYFKEADDLSQAICLNSEGLSRAFNLEIETKSEFDCSCTLSLDPCRGPKFGCGSGCLYCYAPYTKVSPDLKADNER